MKPRKPKTHCPAGHAMEEGNVRLDTRGARICITCARATSLRYRQRHPEVLKARRSTPEAKQYIKDRNRAERASGITYNGYKASVNELIGRPLILEAMQHVRKTGVIHTGGEIVGKWRWSALLHFHKGIHSQVKKMAAQTVPFRKTAPAIIRDPSDLLGFVESLMPSYLTRDFRNDVVGDMMLALVERRITRAQAPEVLHLFIRDNYKRFHNRFDLLRPIHGLEDINLTRAWHQPSESG